MNRAADSDKKVEIPAYNTIKAKETIKITAIYSKTDNMHSDTLKILGEFTKDFLTQEHAAKEEEEEEEGTFI